jgi:hypothetical protein
MARRPVPAASHSALTNKAGISFSFMGIVLATPPSIKDSDCAGVAAGASAILDRTPSLKENRNVSENKGVTKM